jgi:lactoylglutathione lyase
VRATALNHVSISARDLEESARFYEEVFGLERLPTPTFGNPVVWFRLGDGQLHLFQRGEDEAPQYHHFGVEVDDFEAFYLRLTELGIRDSASLGEIRELPSGEVQMYLRDPGGNLVEIDWPDARTLERTIVTDLGKLADDQPQAPGAEQASLFTGRPGRAG